MQERCRLFKSVLSLISYSAYCKEISFPPLFFRYSDTFILFLLSRNTTLHTWQTTALIKLQLGEVMVYAQPTIGYTYLICILLAPTIFPDVMLLFVLFLLCTFVHTIELNDLTLFFFFLNPSREVRRILFRTDSMWRLWSIWARRLLYGTWEARIKCECYGGTITRECKPLFM